jgi:hypothetical protein
MILNSSLVTNSTPQMKHNGTVKVGLWDKLYALCILNPNLIYLPFDKAVHCTKYNTSFR